MRAIIARIPPGRMSKETMIKSQGRTPPLVFPWAIDSLIWEDTWAGISSAAW